MSELSGITPIIMIAQESLGSIWQSVAAVFGLRPVSNIEVPLKDTPGIDPRFIPRVPMKADNIDVSLLGELGKMGLKRGKEISAETHPEFFAEWMRITKNAGLTPPPQLILCESKMANAFTMGSRAEVIVTTGLLKKLDMRESIGILSHELGHATSDHTTPRAFASLLIGAPAAIAGGVFALRGGFAGLLKRERGISNWLAKDQQSIRGIYGQGLYALIGGRLGLIAANQLTVRPTELDADRKGAAIGGDPLAIASALTKLESDFDKKPILRTIAYLFSGYPTTGYRVKKLHEIANQRQASPGEPMGQPTPGPVGAVPAQVPGSNISGIELAERIVMPPILDRGVI